MATTHEQLYAAATSSLARRPQAILREMHERRGLIPSREEVANGRIELAARTKQRIADLKVERDRIIAETAEVQRLIDARATTISGAQSEQL